MMMSEESERLEFEEDFHSVASQESEFRQIWATDISRKAARGDFVTPFNIVTFLDEKQRVPEPELKHSNPNAQMVDVVQSRQETVSAALAQVKIKIKEALKSRSKNLLEAAIDAAHRYGVANHFNREIIRCENTIREVRHSKL